MDTTHTQDMPQNLQEDFDDVIGFGPRVSSLNRIVMFEGWLVGDFWYAASETEVLDLIKAHYPKIKITKPAETMHKLHRQGLIYWTDWYSEPKKDWWIQPTPKRALDMIQAWADTHIEELWLSNMQDTTSSVSADELTGYIQELLAILKHGKQ